MQAQQSRYGAGTLADEPGAVLVHSEHSARCEQPGRANEQRKAFTPCSSHPVLHTCSSRTFARTGVPTTPEQVIVTSGGVRSGVYSLCSQDMTIFPCVLPPVTYSMLVPLSV